MAFWLMKTEPDVFGYHDLERTDREPWDGVRNPVAAKHLRAMKPGDAFLFYHTGKERAIVGVGRVLTDAYPDPTSDDPRWVAVDTAPAYRFKQPVTLAAIKADPSFTDWALVRQSRLSVMPVSESEWRRVHAMGETEPVL